MSIKRETQINIMEELLEIVLPDPSIYSTFGGRKKSGFLRTLRHSDDYEANSALHSILANENFTEDDTIELLQTYLERKRNAKAVDLVIKQLMKIKNLVTTLLVELLKSCDRWEESRTTYYSNVIKNLLSNGADLNAKDENGTTPLYWAFHAKNHEVINILNDHGANFGVITETDENLFHTLAKKPDSSVKVSDSTQERLFDLLLRKGCCDMNAKTKTDKETPLHFAADSGNLALVRKLIEHGAEVDCKNIHQETPLHLAVRSHSRKVVDFLLKNGADVNSRDVSGYTPAHYGAKSHEKAPQILLKWKAYMNTKTVGETPFLRAIRFNNLYEVSEMLAYGANINDDSVVSLMKSDYIRDDMRYYLIQHWFTLDIAKLPATTKYADIADRYNNNRYYRGMRLPEIEIMKKTFINDRISIYSFLHMDFGRRRGYLNCKKLKNLIESSKIKGQFLHYAVVIRASYHETVVWKSLLEPAKRGWFKLTGILLPDECLESIFVHLRNEDLVGMVEFDEDN